MRKLRLEELRPAQFAFGLAEIEEQLKKCEKLSKKELKKLVKEHVVTVVIAPNGDPYIIDGHHHAYLFWCLGVKKITVKVEKDFSKSHLSYRSFWHEMKVHRWAHLYDQFGEGPREPVYLPPSVQGLADDPYRSLAWLVRKAGGYDDTKNRFADFEWANFFRRHRLLHDRFERDFGAVVTRALALCCTRSASRLPGYRKPRRKK